MGTPAMPVAVTISPRVAASAVPAEYRIMVIGTGVIHSTGIGGE